MYNIRDEFLSEEDLDLRNLTMEELLSYWNMWLEQAQAAIDKNDKYIYTWSIYPVK